MFYVCGLGFRTQKFESVSTFWFSSSVWSRSNSRTPVSTGVRWNLRGWRCRRNEPGSQWKVSLTFSWSRRTWPRFQTSPLNWCVPQLDHQNLLRCCGGWVDSRRESPTHLPLFSTLKVRQCPEIMCMLVVTNQVSFLKLQLQLVIVSLTMWPFIYWWSWLSSESELNHTSYTRTHCSIDHWSKMTWAEQLIGWCTPSWKYTG